MAKTTFEELEGREVFFPDFKDEYQRGIVIGCDYDIGITVVDKNDKTNYLMCCPGPSAPEDYMGEGYKTIFYSIISMIKKSEIHAHKINKLRTMVDFGYSHRNHHSGMAKCPFSH
jgi:hypothetical protein